MIIVVARDNLYSHGAQAEQSAGRRAGARQDEPLAAATQGVERRARHEPGAAVHVEPAEGAAGQVRHARRRRRLLDGQDQVALLRRRESQRCRLLSRVKPL